MPAARPFRSVSALLLSLLLAVTPVHAQAPVTDQLPEIGEISGNLMTQAEEHRLGQAFMRSIRASQDVIDDPLLNDYLKDLGQRLLRHSR